MTFNDVSPMPIIEAAKKLQSSEISGLDESADELIQFILHYAEGLHNKLENHFSEYETLLREIRSVKLENKRQKEKCDELWDCLEKALDEQFKDMSPMDQSLYLAKAREAYIGSWEKLDDKSRTMLATALSIHDAFRNSTDRDWSPVIIECCRAFENEYKIKLYDDFVPTVDPYKSSDAKDPYTFIMQAAGKYKESGCYFLSLADMIKCIKELKNNFKRCSLSDALSSYLFDNQWNKTKLMDQSFTNNSLAYTDQYRNRSAHPNIMGENDVTECIRLTKQLLLHFISCMPATKNI